MAVFVRVVECGSFTIAARELGMTPSAASRQVTRLEKALRMRLLERTTRKLKLSEPGVEAFRHCRDMLSAAHDAVGVADRFMEAPHGLVRVSVPKAFGRVVIQPLIPSFLEQYPAVDLQLLVTDRDVDLIDDCVDIAIRVTDTPAPGLVARPLTEVRHVLCATPTYLAAHGVPTHPDDLATHDCLYLGEHPGDNLWHFRRGDDSTTVPVRGRYVVNHSEMRLEGILHHLGIGCLPYFTARAALGDGRVVQVIENWQFIAPYQGTAFALYAPNRFLPPKFRVFIDHLVENLRYRRALTMAPLSPR